MNGEGKGLMEARSAEELFFRALQAHLPGKVLYNGDGGGAAEHLRGLGLAVPNRHWGVGLPAATAAALDALLQGFGGARRGWPEADLLPGIDGFITGPPVGPCLVEFDGAEHFSPYRLSSLAAIEGLVETSFDLAAYRGFCTAPALFREFWAKCRLPAKALSAGRVIRSHAQLAGILSRGRGAARASGYARAVRGFPFAGGRIAQRAYHDTLLDCLPQTAVGRASGLRPTLRVAIWDPRLPDPSNPRAEKE